MDTPDRALITHVQRFSVHDGPGIRTTVFFKGCPLRCRWCQNPETLRPHAELAVHADRCRGSGGCRRACPTGALSAAGGAGRVRLARPRCDACGRCVPACPFAALEIIGRAVGVDDLAAEVARDAPFFRASGGGVTLSGGEPLAQPAAALALAAACRARGIGVGLETCGAVRWERLAALLPLLDFVYFDLKAVDAARHRQLTGADNGPVLDNARRLIAAGAPVTFRTPVVPGLNDGDEDLGRLAAFLRDAGRPALHLLALHTLGEAKLAALDFPRPRLDLVVDGRGAARAVRAAAARLRAGGIEVSP